jgi:Lrp/AsnC family leucine-responsive transcriptional regulator
MSEFDATDRRILAALQKDGRMTNADLSDAANLSPSA